jgi:hypothetical protein
MGLTALLPLRRKWCYGFLSPFKIHRPRSGSNPRTLGPVASTLTTSPPKSTVGLLDKSKAHGVTCNTKRSGVSVNYDCAVERHEQHVCAASNNCRTLLSVRSPSWDYNFSATPVLRTAYLLNCRRLLKKCKFHSRTGHEGPERE